MKRCSIIRCLPVFFTLLLVMGLCGGVVSADEPPFNDVELFWPCEHTGVLPCTVACLECGEIMPDAVPHTYDDEDDTDCNVCDEVRVFAAIVVEPEDAGAAMGKTIKVYLEAEGDGLTYQWHYKNDGEKNYSKSSNQTATYSTTMTATSKNRMVYCVVTDAYGKSVTTEPVYLREAPGITTQPKATPTKLNATAKVTVVAAGDDLTYTWYYKNAGASKYTKVSGSSPSYSVKMTKDTKNRTAYCVIEDKWGFTATTNTVTFREALSIVTQPKTTYAKTGATAKLTITASGDSLKYAWYYKNSGASKFTKSSTTASTYSATLSSTTKNRQVYCVVTDTYGNSVTSNTVTIRQAVSITTQPKTTYAKSGATAKLTIKAAGDTLKYAWYYKNSGASKFTKASVTTSSYSVKVSSTTKNRQVYCVVTDKWGNKVTSSTVTIRQAVSITTQPKTTYAKSGATAKLTIKAAGDGLKYTWYYKNASAKKFTKASVTTSSYSVKVSSTTKNRQVYCVVTDKWGNKVTSGTVTIRQAVSITTQPKTVSVKKNATAKVTVKATGDGLKYTWYYKNASAKKFTKATVKTASYSVKMTATVKNRVVYCVVTDKWGKTVTTNKVTLKMK